MSIVLDGESLKLSVIEVFLSEKAKVTINKEVLNKIKKSCDIVKDSVDKKKIVYGINTGFGKLCNTIIDEKDLKKLQLNLLRSHAIGVGEYLSKDSAKTSILIRLNSLLKGNSGVTPDTINSILTILNSDAYPLIPKIGSLGASGDLAPLAHFALLLIGEGECIYKGEKITGKKLLKNLNLKPLSLEPKEGLALINGLAFSSGIFSVDLLNAKNVIIGGLCAVILSLSSYMARIDAFSPKLHSLKPHKGQMFIAELLYNALKDSKIKDSTKRVQDPYSMRCIPQILGPIIDCYEYCKNVLEIEINSATDNPLIILDSGEIISGGNFHGEPIALASDFLGFSLNILGEISERRVNQLLDPNLNEFNKPFLANNPGIESGFMIAQYTDAAIISRNKILSYPACMTSIPVSANQEDFVSQAANSCLKLSEIIENLSKIVAIELLVSAQALEERNLKEVSGKTVEIYDFVRNLSEPLKEDRSLSKDINIVASEVLKGNFKKLLPSCEEL